MVFSEKELSLINDTIISIYSIDDLKNMRNNFLLEVSQIIPYDCAMFDFANSDRAKQWNFFDPVSININESYVKEYYSHFQQIDYTYWFFFQFDYSVYKDTDLIKNSVREKTEIYNNWMKPLGVYYGSGSSINKNGTMLGSVSLFRGKASSDFTSRDLYLLNLFNQHLANRLYQLFPRGIDPGNYIDQEYKDGTFLRYNLTVKEKEVAELLFEGLNNAQIGEKLFITESTVKKHLTSIFNKCEVKSRVQLIKLLA